MIVNPIQPNPIFETLPPPWQLSLLDAWMASVNAAANALYADPTSFNVSVNTPPATLVFPLGTNDIVFPNVTFQTSDNPYNNLNGLFTAPAPGIYRFESAINAVWPVAPGSGAAYFSLNGSLLSSIGAYLFVTGSATSGNQGFAYNCGAVTVRMALGDTMSVKFQNNGPNPANIAFPDFTWFSGSIVR